MSFNKIKEFPTEIGKLKRLRELHANSNHLTSLPKEFGLLHMLEVLYILFPPLIQLTMDECPRCLDLHSVREFSARITFFHHFP